MKYGIREICEVVLKAKSNRKIGNKMFYKGEPVIYFDSLKTSTLEGATTTVYATGGRGNARLMAWEGERTVTFTMEDALISPLGLMILTGAGLVEGEKVAPVHTVEITDEFVYSVENNRVAIDLKQVPSSKKGADIYVMIKDGDEITTEPYIAQWIAEESAEVLGSFTEAFADYVGSEVVEASTSMSANLLVSAGVTKIIYNNSETDVKITYTGDYPGGTNAESITLTAGDGAVLQGVSGYGGRLEHEVLVEASPLYETATIAGAKGQLVISSWKGYEPNLVPFATAKTVLVDYYVDKPVGSVQQIEITPDSFAGNFYLEASTLFRATTGEDHPAEFIIPNCKIQSNFSFAMAASGDPSTFSFTMDAFPDYTRFDETKKVICAMQIIDPEGEYENDSRIATAHDYKKN